MMSFSLNSQLRFVRERFIRERNGHPKAYGLLTAVDPGFSSENLLLRL